MPIFRSVGVPATGAIPQNSVSGPGGLQQQLPGHGTSAGFCNICHKFVSNRTNHKYVHSQVLTTNISAFLFALRELPFAVYRSIYNLYYIFP